MPGPRGGRRQLTLEPLEQRILLSGNVDAFVTGSGDLRLAGDDLPNQVQVDQIGLETGEVRITPLDGTEVNGGATPVVLDGFRGSIRAFMEGGDDEVDIQDMLIPGGVRFDGGDGNNLLAFADTDVGDDVEVKSGEGGLTASAANSNFARNFDVRAFLGLLYMQFATCTFGGALGLLLHQGQMQMDASDTSVDSVKARLGDVNSSVDLRGLIVRAALYFAYKNGLFGGDIDYSKVGGPVTIRGGRDSSTDVSLHGTKIGGDLTVTGGEGTHQVSLSGVEVSRDLQVRTRGPVDLSVRRDSIIGANLAMSAASGFSGIFLASLVLAGKLSLNMHDGGDVHIGSWHGHTLVDIGGDVFVRSGDAADQSFSLKNAKVAGDVKLFYREAPTYTKFKKATILSDVLLKFERIAGKLSVDRSSITGSVRAIVGDGDSELNVEDTSIDGGLHYSARQGTHTLTLDQLRVLVFLNLVLGNGFSVLGLLNSTINGDTAIKTSGDIDTVTIGSTAMVGDVKVDLGGGDDIAQAVDSSVTGKLVVDGGKGDDTVGVLGNGNAYALEPILLGIENQF